MIIIFCDCRSLQKSFALNNICLLKDKHNLDIVILLETHVQLFKVPKVHRVIDFDCDVECIPLVGHSGDIPIF